MTETGGEQDVAREAHRVLASVGCSEAEAALVLDCFAPPGLLHASPAEHRTELVARGARYVRDLEVARFQDRNLDLTLVVPPFVALELAGAFEAAIELVVAGHAATVDAFGPAARAREQAWLRAVHLHLAVADHFGIEPELNLTEVPLLHRLEEHEDLTLAFRALDRLDSWTPEPIDLAPPPPPQPVSDPVHPGQLIEVSGELVQPFTDLDGLLRAADAEVRVAADWSRADRRAHQEVLAVARIAASSLGRAPGSRLTLLLELEAVPAPTQRSLERFPLVRLHTLWALGAVRPSGFGHIRRESELHGASQRSLWSAITLGVPGTGGPRERGVVGLLAEAARPSVDQLRATIATGGR